MKNTNKMKKQKAHKEGLRRAKQAGLRKSDEGVWHEIAEAFDPETAQLLPIEAAYGHRVFVRGHIGKMLVVEVPPMMSEPQKQQLGQKISEQGVSLLIMTSRMRFWKLKRVDHEKQRELEHAHQEANAEAERQERLAAQEGDGARPLAERDGDRSDGDSDGQDAARGVRQDPGRGEARSGADEAGP